MKKYLAFIVLMVASVSAYAAHFTPAQYLAIKNYVQADPVMNVQLQTGDGASVIAALFGQPATPAFIVWRPDVPVSEIETGTGFDWTQVDNLTVGKDRIWQRMTARGVIDVSKTNVQLGISEAWKGTAPMIAVQSYILATSKRQASVLEKLFAVGTGTTLSPAVMTHVGSVYYTEITQAMGW